MSRAILGRLDRRLGGRLETALAIFDGTYERPFFDRWLRWVDVMLDAEDMDASPVLDSGEIRRIPPEWESRLPLSRDPD